METISYAATKAKKNKRKSYASAYDADTAYDFQHC